MRTTVNLDEAALAEAMRFAPGKTKAEVINEALRDFARRGASGKQTDGNGRKRV